MAEPAIAAERQPHAGGRPKNSILRGELVTSFVLLAPAVALIAFVFCLPLLLVLKNSVITRDGLSLFYFEKFLSDPFYIGILWRTLRLGFLGTLATFLPGY